MKTIKAHETGVAATPLEGSEQGFMLLGLIVAIAIILIFLGAAASQVAFSLRREREVESARRADQYVRAIRRFYLKTQHYPGSIEQLENTNNVRYLRKRYVDPLTGKDDYRLIQVGKNQTTVKGFFGEPLAGIASAGLGSAAGMQSSGIGGPTAPGGPGATGTPGPGGAANTGDNTSTGTAGATGAAGAAGAVGAAGQANSPLGAGLLPSSGVPGSLGPFMGVGSSASGNSIVVVNEQTTYQTWEFLYDPRVEKLRQAAALNAGASTGTLGTTPLGTGTPPLGTGTTPQGTGTTPQGPNGPPQP
jgi:type II secretory pathway pseudopilin PulG